MLRKPLMTQSVNGAREAINTTAFPVTKIWKREGLWEGKLQNRETEMMVVINIVHCILRKVEACAQQTELLAIKSLEGEKRGKGRKKEKNSYKLSNGNFFLYFAAWQKHLGHLIAALSQLNRHQVSHHIRVFLVFTVTFGSDRKKKKLVLTHLLFWKSFNVHLLDHLLMVRSYGKLNLFYICHWEWVDSGVKVM